MTGRGTMIHSREGEKGSSFLMTTRPSLERERGSIEIALDLFNIGGLL
jgi:hypothetical protein